MDRDLSVRWFDRKLFSVYFIDSLYKAKKLYQIKIRIFTIQIIKSNNTVENIYYILRQERV